MSGWEQVQALLKSRKFWAMVTAIVAAAAALATNQIDMWQFIIAVVTATAAFSTGVAIEDAGAKIGAAKNTTAIKALEIIASRQLAGDRSWEDLDDAIDEDITIARSALETK